MLLMSFGPYDLEVGESIEILYGYVVGMMNRERIVAGGEENIRKIPLDDSYTYPGSTLDSLWTYAKLGLDSLYASYDAAVELIYNNFQPVAVPPATIGEKGNTLLVDDTKIGQITVSFEPLPETYIDPISQQFDVAGYRIYRSKYSYIGPWELLIDIPQESVEQYVSEGLISYTDEDFMEGTIGGGVFYTVTSYDTEGLESAKISYNRYAVFPPVAPGPADGTGTYVVPNPFRIVSDLPGTRDDDRITFVNVPAKCKIRIYTLAGDLVRELDHDDGSGQHSWGSTVNADYQLTKYLKKCAPGVYVYQVESQVAGYKGESFIGKLAIIR